MMHKQSVEAARAVDEMDIVVGALYLESPEGFGAEIKRRWLAVRALLIDDADVTATTTTRTPPTTTIEQNRTTTTEAP